jgi:type 2 lantibiotic biosynthesis protein LanM
MVRTATIDEILSDEFETLPGQKGDADAAARRAVAWCRSCASGDWSLFARRLERDGLTIAQVLARFATVRRSASAPKSQWIDDAKWIEAALQIPIEDSIAAPSPAEPCAFEHLLVPVVAQAEARLGAGVGGPAIGNLTDSARASMRHLLLEQLCELCAPVLYDRFAKAKKFNAARAGSSESLRNGDTSQYSWFIADMKRGGFRRLFEEKPVLMRAIATITRQWIDTSSELVLRLDADLAAIRRDILDSGVRGRIATIEGKLSDPHNRGHSVHVLSFEDGGRIVYKPKDLRLDTAWFNLVERLNRADPPIELKAVRTITRDSYGWTEFIHHTGCTDQDGFALFFRRAGAWLALFHCFAASDMHQENIIAASDHPVPIDLETILQPLAEEHSHDIEGQALESALKIIANSVSSVGLLPAYLRSPDNRIFALGGLVQNRKAGTKLGWSNINSDLMRPSKSNQRRETLPNLPYVDGRYAQLGDHVEDFIRGFEDYAKFLLRRRGEAKEAGLFDGFAGLPVRKILRPTQFYYMLLQRLKDHRTMDDGVAWSAQADFIARLADWNIDSDLFWPLHRDERAALLALNVPHFVSASDGNEIRGATGISVEARSTSGLDRARARIKGMDERDIAWQVEVIRLNTSAVSRSVGPAATVAKPKRHLRADAAIVPTRDVFISEADRIAAELSDRAIRRGPGAAWIGLDWLGDSEVFQLTPMGPDLYNGASGIALFLAAHAAVTSSGRSGELALAAIAHLRKNLGTRNAARMARSLGLGGASGLGSIVYALTLMSKFLDDAELLAAACAVSELFTDDLIGADARLDVFGGSAGGILGLLRLYRDTRLGDVLTRATKCGEHLLGRRRVGREGLRSWVGGGLGARCLNGMSHGAAGFAYALASLSAATSREEFATAAAECIAFENSSYDSERGNWPDLQENSELSWPFQWCHGAPGIGLARIAMHRLGEFDSELLINDIENAVAGIKRAAHRDLDTLCCGTLGNIEFLCEAGNTLRRADLRDRASRQLAAVMENAAVTGDYRWAVGSRRFNLGLFRGLAGVGYTMLRRVEKSFPNVLIWE